MTSKIQIEKLHPELFVRFNSFLYNYVIMLKKQHNCSCTTYEELLAQCRTEYKKQIKRYASSLSDEERIKLVDYYLHDAVSFEAAATVLAVLYGGKKPNYYVIQKEFFSKFLNVKLANVKFEHLPEYFSGYIKLPIPLVDSEGSEYHHVYAYCGKDTDFIQFNQTLAKKWRAAGHQSSFQLNQISKPDAALSISPTGEILGDHVLQIAFISNPPAEYLHLSAEGEIRTFGMRLPLDTSSLIAPLLETTVDTEIPSFFNSDPEVKEAIVGYPQYLKTIINLLLYINSGSPDIREFRNTAKIAGRNRKIRTSETWSTLDIKLIGFDWKKDIIKNYSLASWEVEGHFRWQRYGEQRSLIKLIWIDPHPAFRQKQVEG